MEKFGWFLALLFVVCAVAVCIVAVQNVGVILATRRLEAEAAKARADAERLATQLDLAQAEAQVETARGERAVLESAARAVDNNTRLVTWFSVRGDLRTILMLVALGGLAACGVIAVRAMRGGRDAQDTTHHDHA